MALLPPTHFSEAKTYQDFLELEASIETWEKNEFARDHVKRLEQIRNLLTDQLIYGTHDKWGVEHDDTKREVVWAINTLLAYPFELKTRIQAVRKGQEQIEARQRRSGGIHGLDDLTSQN